MENNRNIYLYPILVFFLILAIRSIFIYFYGVNVLYADQWDAEMYFLYKPYTEGTLSFRDLFKPHNEHRIFFTRLLDLALFAIDGKANALREMYVQSVFPAFLGSIFVFISIKQSVKISKLTILIILLCFGLPYSYENILSGFQSCFYLTILFSVLSFLLISYSKNKIISNLMLFALCCFTFLNIASGFITSFICSLVFAYKIFNNKNNRIRNITLSIIFLTLCIFLFKLIPNVQGHNVLTASSLNVFFKALFYALGWPNWPFNGAGILLFWFPVIYLVYKNSRKLFPLDNNHIFILSVLCWITIQAVAIAYKRSTIFNRYYDILLLQPVILLIFIDFHKKTKLTKKTELLLKYTIIIVLIASIKPILQNYRILNNIRTTEKNTIITSMELPISEIDTYIENNPVPYPNKERMSYLLKDPVINKIIKKTYIK